METRPYGPFPYLPIDERPKITWPNGAHVALWIVPNIEFFPLDQKISPEISSSVPDVPNWADRDYGARVGVFRMMEVMTRYGIRGTVALNSQVCDFYPQIVERCMKLDWEFMGHNQTNARRLDAIPPDTEKELIFDVFQRIESFTGQRPRGWLGSGLRETWNTLDYLIEAGCDYVADWPNDDQPYQMDIDGKQLVSIPYSHPNNDLQAFVRRSMSPEEFEQVIRRQFDTLYREGEESGRVMAICLHPYLIGVAHRIGCLDNALSYICNHDKVWHATGSEIIDHYLASGATF